MFGSCDEKVIGSANFRCGLAQGLNIIIKEMGIFLPFFLAFWGWLVSEASLPELLGYKHLHLHTAGKRISLPQHSRKCLALHCEWIIFRTCPLRSQPLVDWLRGHMLNPGSWGNACSPRTTWILKWELELLGRKKERMDTERYQSGSYGTNKKPSLVKERSWLNTLSSSTNYQKGWQTRLGKSACISLLRLPQQNTINLGPRQTDKQKNPYYLKVLEARSLRSRCQQGRFLLRAVSKNLFHDSLPPSFW